MGEVIKLQLNPIFSSSWLLLCSVRANTCWATDIYFCCLLSFLSVWVFYLLCFWILNLLYISPRPAAAWVLILFVNVTSFSLLSLQHGFFKRAVYYRIMPKHQGVRISRAERHQFHLGFQPEEPQKRLWITNWREMQHYEYWGICFGPWTAHITLVWHGPLKED